MTQSDVVSYWQRFLSDLYSTKGFEALDQYPRSMWVEWSGCWACSRNVPVVLHQIRPGVPRCSNTFLLCKLCSRMAPESDFFVWVKGRRRVVLLEDCATIKQAMRLFNV